MLLFELVMSILAIVAASGFLGSIGVLVFAYYEPFSFLKHQAVSVRLFWILTGIYVFSGVGMLLLLLVNEVSKF